MKAEPEALIFKFDPKHDSKQVLQILKALKQASHVLHTNPNSTKTDGNNTVSTSSAIKALLELEHESESILFNDPHLTALSTHLTAFKTLINKSCNAQRYNTGLRSFLTRRVNSLEITKLAGSIENEIQAWIDREFIKTLALTVRTDSKAKDQVLIDLIQQFEDRIRNGFDRNLQDSILRSRVFTNLESILTEPKLSKNVREASALAIAELIRFNKDVFVGQVLMSRTVCALVSLSSVRSIQILCILIRSIKSPIVDEIVSNGKIVKIVEFVTCNDASIREMAVNCVMEIGYFGRKEAIDAMLEEDLVKKLVELQRSDDNNNDNDIEKCRFSSCVARFAVQLEVGEGLRRREKREVKQEVLQRVREACVCEAEAATIVAEVLWGASP